MKLNKIWSIVFLIYFAIMVLIVYSAYKGSLPTNLPTIKCFDECGHFILIGITALFAHLALNRHYFKLFFLKLPSAPTIIMLLSTIEEFFQKLSPRREFSYLDLLSDLGGVIFFLILDYTFRILIRKHKSPLT